MSQMFLHGEGVGNSGVHWKNHSIIPMGERWIDQSPRMIPTGITVPRHKELCIQTDSVVPRCFNRDGMMKRRSSPTRILTRMPQPDRLIVSVDSVAKRESGTKWNILGLL